ncbi:potassium transporter [Sulfurovum sp. bin170]|uniref:cation:proton antiporter n=1 Tax=Sulfurovum sp. bin170 TaxID=2695268 RepID=UPI0013E08103|nr:cation:proton antiporter [Sulfurovum sp. bin170]NEW60965.1 potassium transporter [Sulfurovum sp. bin170]
MEHILIILIVTIAISTVINVFLKKFDIPTVIGYIATGLITMQLFSFGEHSQETLAHLAEFGIVFLMFTIGLEFSMGHMKSMKKEVFVYGALQVMLSGVLFTFLANSLFGLETKSAIVIGFALALSSTAIVIKVLTEKNETHSGYGRIAVGILIFQDLAVIPMLLMISIFTSENSSISELLLDTLISAIVVFFILFIVGKYFIERFFDWVISSKSEEIFLVAVILVVITASVVAELFGFSYTLGAFIAGMTIAETKFRYRIEADLVPFRDILLGIFFVTIGMQIELGIVVEYGFVILGLLFLIMLIKALIIFGILQFFIQKRTAIKSAMTLMQVGEFALVIFALAFSNGLISSDVNQIMIMTVVLSMVLTPFVLNNIKLLSDNFFTEPTQLRERAIVSTGYQNHIIICGYGPLGQSVVKKFKEKNLLYLILEHDIKVVDKAIEGGEKSIFFANAAQKGVLEHFSIKKSLAIIVAIENEHQLRLICENIDSFDADINSVVKVKNSSEEEIIRNLNVKHIINSRDTISEILVKSVLECKI